MKNSVYRVKTLPELKRGKGTDWRRPEADSAAFVIEMDYLAGRVLSPFEESCFLGGRLTLIDAWQIEKWMVKKVKVEVNEE